MTDAKIIAALDIGTNSVKATVATVLDGGAIDVLEEMSRVTRLGEGVDSDGRLRPAAITRTLDTVVEFCAKARGLGAFRISGVGTSALRDAANGRELLDGVRERCGVDVEVVTGLREAELAYRAVTADRQVSLDRSKPVLIFDIGGGSTELIAGDASGIRNHASLDIGAVRLTERYIKSDPPADAEVDRAAAAARDALATFGIEKGVVVAGIGGTALNAAAVAQAVRRLEPVEKGNLHGQRIASSDMALAESLCRQLPLAERRQLPGLEPERADVITAGIVILRELLAAAGADGFVLSIRGMRYGLLAEIAASAAAPAGPSL